MEDLLKLKGFLKDCLFESNFKDEIVKNDYFDKLLKLFTDIRDKQIVIVNNTEFENILIEIEKIFALNHASLLLLEYFYGEFEDRLDFSKKKETLWTG